MWRRFKELFRAHRVDRFRLYKRLALGVGGGFQIATTHFPANNHNGIFTVGFLFSRSIAGRVSLQHKYRETIRRKKQLQLLAGQICLCLTKQGRDAGGGFRGCVLQRNSQCF